MSPNVCGEAVQRSSESPLRSTHSKPGLALLTSFLTGTIPVDPSDCYWIRRMRISKSASARDRPPALGRPREKGRHQSQCQPRSDCGAHMRSVAATDRRNSLEPWTTFTHRTASPGSPFGICQTPGDSPHARGTLERWGAWSSRQSAVSLLATAGTLTAPIRLLAPTSWPQAMHFGSRNLASTMTSAEISVAAVGTANRRRPRVESPGGTGCEVGMSAPSCKPASRHLRWRQC